MLFYLTFILGRVRKIKRKGDEGAEAALGNPLSPSRGETSVKKKDEGNWGHKN